MLGRSHKSVCLHNKVIYITCRSGQAEEMTLLGTFSSVKRSQLSLYKLKGRTL